MPKALIGPVYYISDHYGLELYCIIMVNKESDKYVITTTEGIVGCKAITKSNFTRNKTKMEARVKKYDYKGYREITKSELAFHFKIARACQNILIIESQWVTYRKVHRTNPSNDFSKYHNKISGDYITIVPIKELTTNKPTARLVRYITFNEDAPLDEKSYCYKFALLNNKEPYQLKLYDGTRFICADEYNHDELKRIDKAIGIILTSKYSYYTKSSFRIEAWRS